MNVREILNGAHETMTVKRVFLASGSIARARAKKRR